MQEKEGIVVPQEEVPKVCQELPVSQVRMKAGWGGKWYRAGGLNCKVWLFDYLCLSLDDNDQYRFLKTTFTEELNSL